MEQEDEKKKKLNDDVIAFMRKRSEAEAPRYTARLKTYLDIQHKHRRAAAARHLEQGFKKISDKKPAEAEVKPATDNAYSIFKDPAAEGEKIKRAGGGRMVEKDLSCARSSSRSDTGELSERCCRRRRRRRRSRHRRRRSRGRRRRRRRRSCGGRRRRRRRRSCGRRRRSRRRRSRCGRRRRRRSRC